jgi:adenylate kinase
MKNTNMNIVVLGLPGAGKRAQAERLAEYLDVPKLDMGDILRENKSYVTQDGKTVGEIIDNGNPVSNETAAALLAKYLDEIGYQKSDGLVMDGYPRTGDQASAADDLLDIDIILIIDVSEEVIFERLTNRRACPECERQYHLKSNPPEKEGICDVCGTELVQRADDTEESIQERIEWQRNGLDEIIEAYGEDTDIIHVDGEQSIPAVWDNVRSRIRSYLSA